MSEPVKLTCPECRRFLTEVIDYAKLPCPNCGCEVTYRSKRYRRNDVAPVAQFAPAGIERRVMAAS